MTIVSGKAARLFAFKFAGPRRAEHEQEISRSGFDAVESSSTGMFNARWMWAVEEYFEHAALL
jgi:hypothetical protein